MNKWTNFFRNNNDTVPEELLLGELCIGTLIPSPLFTGNNWHVIDEAQATKRTRLVARFAIVVC